jgi:UDP-N-acetylglucosamine 2-epimerase
MTSSGASGRVSSVNWVSIVGARPQFVKLAPFCRAIDLYNEQGKSPSIQHCIIHTGQHYDHEVADVFFEQMQIPEPSYNLEVGSASHGNQLARMLERIESILISEPADWVIVYGDTNSTLAGALIAARLKIPLAHVEAGCRSGDQEPEEQNRIVSDHLSQLLLAPCENAVRNLRREGIGLSSDPHCRRAVMVGDILYDALLQNVQIAAQRAATNLGRFGFASKQYYLLTIHRAENTNEDSLREIIQAASSLDYPVLFPVHPRTKRALSASSISLGSNIHAIPPLGYLDMLVAERHARKILTDSGGIQKEAFYLGVPCITLRDRTEWPETVAVGANRIGGRVAKSIREALRADHEGDWSASAPYGDGNAAAKIVAELLATGD